MRFLENIDQNVNRDFIPRNYFSPLKGVLPFYSAIIALMVLAIEFHATIGGTIVASVLCVLLLLASAVFTYVRILQTNDMIMASDFQNLLFSAASSLGSSFCFYVRLDGTVVYANDGMRNIFPDYHADQGTALDAILEAGIVSNEDQSKLYSAMSRGKRETFVMGIRGKDGAVNEYFLTIEPLQRPSGYFVVFGRPYYPERVAVTKMSGILNQTNPQKIQAMVELLPFGVYLTSETGIIEYYNRNMLSMLRYEAHETPEQTSVQAMVYHADGFETGEFGLTEFAGTALLECKNKRLLQANLQQKTIYSEDGKIIGFVGIVTTTA